MTELPTTGLQTLATIGQIRQACAGVRNHGILGLVPTMGALHEGHLSLVRAARKQCDAVVVSIFVNPLQFGPSEDFARYPRTLERDLELLDNEGVDLVFTPSPQEIYPHGTTGTRVDPGEIGNRLDGKARPNHFRGVTTVVTKLFHIVMPDFAFFGQKDAAQVAILKAMVHDLNFPLEMVVCPTVRERDGLAMSSRNRYLGSEERRQALALFRALQAGKQAFDSGVCDASELQRAMLRELNQEPNLTVEYAEAVDPDTLLPLEQVSGSALLAVAARVGQTRLIDNILLEAPRA